MDNPNAKAPRRHKAAGVNLRRHKTLPGPLRSIRPARRNMSPASPSKDARLKNHLNKSNPYVGWFRHAPALQQGNKHVLWFDPSTVLQKKRRYVAKSHHLIYHHQNAGGFDERTKAILTLLALKEKLHKNDMADLLKKRGYLRGGGDDDDDLETFLAKQCAETSGSVTVKVLSRLACWLLDVPAESSNGPPKILVETDALSLVSDDDDDSEYDNYDTVSGSRQRSSSFDIMGSSSNAVLSSQAEAYYALTAVHSQMLDEQQPSLPNNNNSSNNNFRQRSSSLGEESSSSSSRLDYDITQMDILKMNRIASRHLDVESILRLPIQTYGPEETTAEEEEPQASTKNETEASAATTTSTDQVQALQQAESRDDSSFGNKEDAKFSWICVPPPREMMEMADDSSTACAISEKDAIKEKEEGHDDVCVICLEQFVPGDRLRVLPCSHAFHCPCIDVWLSGTHSFDDCYTSGCPTCKKRPTEAPPSQQVCVPLNQSDGSVPSWAFTLIGDALARDSMHF